MVEYVYLVVACVLSIELFLRLKFMSYVKSIGRNSNKVFRVIISSNISDHWKEKMVPVYAFILLKNSLLILGILFLFKFQIAFFYLHKIFFTNSLWLLNQNHNLIKLLPEEIFKDLILKIVKYILSISIILLIISNYLKR